MLSEMSLGRRISSLAAHPYLYSTAVKRGDSHAAFALAKRIKLAFSWQQVPLEDQATIKLIVANYILEQKAPLPSSGSLRVTIFAGCSRDAASFQFEALKVDFEKPIPLPNAM